MGIALGKSHLVFGFVSPPLFDSSPKKKEEQMEELAKSGVTAKANGVIVLTLATAKQLQATLKKQIGDT